MGSHCYFIPLHQTHQNPPHSFASPPLYRNCYKYQLSCPHAWKQMAIFGTLKWSPCHSASVCFLDGGWTPALIDWMVSRDFLCSSRMYGKGTGEHKQVETGDKFPSFQNGWSLDMRILYSVQLYEHWSAWSDWEEFWKSLSSSWQFKARFV